MTAETPQANQPTTQEQQPVQKASVFTPKAGMYKDVRGRKIFDSKGNALKLTSGYYDPKTEEEKDLCSYFASLGHLVLVK